MAMSLGNNTTKKDLLWLHGVITVGLMFGFGYLPGFGGITPIGMKLLGIFIGLIYAWSTTSLLWPSFLGFIAICTVGGMPMKNFLAVSMGNDLVVLLIVLCVFIGVIEQAGVVNFIANWFISRKVTYGRPWMFTYFFFLGAYFTGAATDPIITNIIFWGIFYNIAKEIGLKPFEKYSTLVIFGVAWCSVFGASLLPFKGGPLVFFSSYRAITGIQVNFAQYVGYSFIVGMLAVGLYVLLCKYVFKANVDKLKHIDQNFVDPKNLILDKKQKAALSLLFIMLILLLLPSIMPQSKFFLVVFLKQIGLVGTILLLLIATAFLRFDGVPLLNFKLAARSITWDMVFLFAIVLPLGQLLVGENTGIQGALTALMQPVVNTFTPIVALILILLLTTIITNVALNVVVGILAVPVIASIAQTTGIDATPFIIALCYTVKLAFITPAASTPAAMVFANTEWIKPKDIYKYATITILVTFVLVILVALPLFVM